MDAQATFSCSFTQSDLSPVAEPTNLPHWPAQRLLPQQRRDLAIQVLAGTQPVAEWKALPILIRHSPGMMLPGNIYVHSEEAAAALREAEVRFTEVTSEVASPGLEGATTGERI